MWKCCIVSLILIGVSNVKADCFSYSSGPTAGSPVTSQVAVLASGTTGSCPYYNAPNPSVPISGTVSGQTVTKYSLSAGASSEDFGLTGSWSTETVAGQSGTAGMTINTWCTAHNVDAAETTVTSTILHWQNCNGTPCCTWNETLTTVTSYFPRCPADPDAAQPAIPPCNPQCPPQA